MDIEVRPCASTEELRDALNVISHYFGHENTDEDAERFANWIEVDRMHAARADGEIVGGAGAFTYRMSVPGGGSVSAGGVTVVGVLPTHRRRGVLTAMMKAQLEDCRARGDAVAYLWASEATIYGRFGYGLASRMGAVELARERTRFAQPFEPRGTVRLLELEEAAQLFPPLYDEVFAQRPGHVLAQQGVVGDAQAERRSRAAPRRAAQPRAARARRRAGRVRALPRRAGLDGRCRRAAR